MAPWADRKVNFMMLVLQKLGRKESELVGGGGGGGGTRGDSFRRSSRRRSSIAERAGPTFESTLKELLQNLEASVTLSHAIAVADAVIVDTPLKEQLGTTLREVSEANAAVQGKLPLDAVLAAMLGLWDEQMAAAALQTEALLHEMFMQADKNRNGRMSFSEFESLCASLRHTTFEDNVLLDIYDEAIRLTESLSGEESDSVSPEAFARVARSHEMLPPVNVDKFVDAIVLSMHEQEQLSRLQAEDGPTLQLGRGAPKRERVRRTVIKTSAKLGAIDDESFNKKHQLVVAVVLAHDGALDPHGTHGISPPGDRGRTSGGGGGPLRLPPLTPRSPPHPLPPSPPHPLTLSPPHPLNSYLYPALSCLWGRLALFFWPPTRSRRHAAPAGTT